MLLALIMYSPIFFNYFNNGKGGELSVIAVFGLVMVYVVFRYLTKVIITDSGFEIIAIFTVAKIKWAEVTGINKYSKRGIFGIFPDHEGIYDLCVKDGKARINFNLFPVALKQDVLEKLKEYGHLTTG